jgi:hypothetical protein
MKRRLLYLILILIFLAPGTESKNISRIDWINGKLYSTGNSSIAIDHHGYPVDFESGDKLSISESRNISYERSKEKALIDAINIINNIQVDSEKKIKDLILNDVAVRQNITRIIETHSYYKDKTSDSLQTTCELEFKTGYLLTAINYNFPGEAFPAPEIPGISTLYTSFIIDVRGLKIKPMLLPSVLNESGLEIYSKNYINPSYAVRHNMVTYVYNEKDALKHKKAGKHPLFTVALKNMNGYPVVSDDAIKKIFSNKKNIEYLSKCRVIFIIDR